MHRWNDPEGQQRTRPLSQTLILAEAAGRRAGVTRLADVSGLTPFGIPVFQAVRPLSRSLSVSQGKGLTAMAAKVSALLEAAELDVAEHIAPPAECRPTTAMPYEVQAAWTTAPRHARALRLDPAISRRWLNGMCLASGRHFPVPWDLIALDYTVAPLPDAVASSSGLATGNSVMEAAVGAIGELLERDLTTAFGEASRRMRRDLEIDPDSVDDPVIRPLLMRVARAGFDLRLWSLGQPVGIAALRCAIVARGSNVALPPTIGSGCHPSRRVATLRAVLEAVQVHATLVAGARDDLADDDYADPDGQKLDLLFETLSLSRPSMPWSMVPDVQSGTPAASLDRLLAVATERSTLPVIGIQHDSGVAELAVFRVVAPGLADAARSASLKQVVVTVPRLTRGKRQRRPVVFVGPTLSAGEVPAHIEVRPPAVAGDLIALIDDPPRAVGLIDGCFATSPTVWHKEILHLLAAGIPVLGAASLGALRAAELDKLGMVGVGRIHAAYKRGAIGRDDAVMVIHAPAELGHRPLTLSLVDAEAALAMVRMPASDRRMLLRIMRTMSYSERTWERCLARYGERTGRSPPVDVATLAACPSLKRADALTLLAHLSAATDVSPRVMPPLTSTYACLLARVIPTRP